MQSLINPPKEKRWLPHGQLTCGRQTWLFMSIWIIQTFPCHEIWKSFLISSVFWVTEPWRQERTCREPSSATSPAQAESPRDGGHRTKAIQLLSTFLHMSKRSVTILPCELEHANTIQCHSSAPGWSLALVVAQLLSWHRAGSSLMLCCWLHTVFLVQGNVCCCLQKAIGSIGSCDQLY